MLPIPGISDHQCVPTRLDSPCLNAPVVRPITVYLYDRGNFDSISFALEKYFETFETRSASTNIDDLWFLFKHKLLALIDPYIPFKILSAKQRKNKPWLTKEIKTLINKRTRIFKQYNIQKEQSLYAVLKQITLQIENSKK